MMKNRMKRMALLSIAAMLVLGGCTEKEQEPVKEQTVPAEDTAENETEEPQEAELLEEVPEAESLAPAKIYIDTNQKTYYFAESEEAYLYLQYCDVRVESQEHQNLKRNLENWSLERSEGLRSLYASFEEAAQADVSDNDQFYGYNLYQSLKISRNDGKVVSLIEDVYQYTGEAHGSTYRTGINFDAESGKRLSLKDILSDDKHFTEEAAERIIKELEYTYGNELKEDYVQIVEELWTAETEPAWYLDGSGIVIVLQEGMATSSLAGTPQIHLPYTEFQTYIKEAYLPNTSDGVVCFQENQEISLKLPNTGEQVTLMLASEQDPDTGMASVALHLGNSKHSLRDIFYVEDAYLIRENEEIYCLIETDMASDDFVTFIYRLTEGRIEKTDEIAASVDAGNINSGQICMESWVYLLGTYGGVKTYYFDDEGCFVTDDTEFRLKNNEFVLTAATDLPVVMEGVENTLPAGSHIILEATDEASYVTFRIRETGQNGTIFVERDGQNYYQITIDGMDESDCFEVLPYAG